MLKLRSPRVRTAVAGVRVAGEPVTDASVRPTGLTYVRVTDTPPPTVEGNRDDLKIRNLLDDPALRRAMGLDPQKPATVMSWPEPRFDRRRLLDTAA